MYAIKISQNGGEKLVKTRSILLSAGIFVLMGTALAANSIGLIFLADREMILDATIAVLVIYGTFKVK